MMSIKESLHQLFEDQITRLGLQRHYEVQKAEIIGRLSYSQPTKRGVSAVYLYDASKPVDTFWDLGYSDNVSIWLAQSIGFEFRFIDFIQGSQQSLKYYLRELQSRPYVYGTDCLPWDCGTPSLQTGRSVRDQLIAA